MRVQNEIKIKDLSMRQVFFVGYTKTKEKAYRNLYDMRISYQRYRDSNPDIQSQSLLCYLYTIPLSAVFFRFL